MTELILDEQPDGSYLFRVEDTDTFIEFSLSEDELRDLLEAIRE